MTARECPRVRVHTPPAYYIVRSLSGPSLAPAGSVATDGPALRNGEELIYKTRTRRGSV